MSRAEIRVAGECVGRMGAGLLALVGVGREDDEASARELARRLVGLRVFEDADGRMNRSLLDAEASTATLGKTAGKDAEQGKPTYVSVLGRARAA